MRGLKRASRRSASLPACYSCASREMGRRCADTTALVKDEMTARWRVHVTVNGRSYQRDVQGRTLLSDFLRHDLGLHGTHVGCEQGVCGACTVLLDGEAVKSCLMLAVQADGRAITTVEG